MIDIKALKAKPYAPKLSQLTISAVIDGEINAGTTVNGTDGKKETVYIDFTAHNVQGSILPTACMC